MNPGKRWAVAVVVSVMLGACGGSRAPRPDTAAVPPAALPEAGPASSMAADDGGAAVDAGALPEAAPPAHPFAATGVEATTAIDAAIDSRRKALGTCVDGARARRKNVHGKITIEIAFDEEGNLIGVKRPKGEPEDKDFAECVRSALAGAAFPRSHSGVITVKKSFEDQAVYK